MRCLFVSRGRLAAEARQFWRGSRQPGSLERAHGVLATPGEQPGTGRCWDARGLQLPHLQTRHKSGKPSQREVIGCIYAGKSGGLYGEDQNFTASLCFVVRKEMPSMFPVASTGTAGLMRGYGGHSLYSSSWHGARDHGWLPPELDLHFHLTNTMYIRGCPFTLMGTTSQRQRRSSLRLTYSNVRMLVLTIHPWENVKARHSRLRGPGSASMLCG